MCKNYCNCSVCGADKSECLEMGDGTPFCHGFQCTVEDCKRSECISYEEEYDVIRGDY